MTGVIWIIQILHYPAFSWIEPARFSDFHRNHTQRITFIVGPMMIFEMVTGVLLVLHPPRETLLLLNLVLILGIWICTFALSVPLHNQLEGGKDVEKINRLIRTNWPRTFLWTLRSLLLLGVFL